MEFSLTGLYSALMRDIPISDYDRKYVLKRIASEGVTYLAKELPKLSSAVVRGLEIGHFDRADLTSFRFQDATLKFLSGLINQVFDRQTGLLLEKPCGAAVRSIRQLCEYSYKLALKYTEEQEKNAKDNFIKNEEELKVLGRNAEVLGFANELRRDFEREYSELARCSVSDILKKFRPRPTNGTYNDCDEIYFFDRISTARAREYPFDAEAQKGFYKPYPGLKQKRFMNRPVTEPDYSELLLVPKDSRGPRTICREFLKRVETQMAYFDFMIDGLNRQSEGAINFLDQLVNRKIAEESSVTKCYSTLDLKDASDRVSIQVAKTIFRNSPGIRWFFEGSRRANFVVIDGRYHRLSKVAGMGSGLTFPTMSLLISLAICNRVKKLFPHLQYKDVRKRVFVYGDDICVPSEWVPAAYDGLARIGLKVNQKKSFTRGYFRESCGGDYYYGLDVTPVRLKLTNSKVEHLGKGTISIANSAMSFKQVYEHTKELFSSGYENACKYLLGMLGQFYAEKFGVRMAPGAFDVDCSLPLDYTKGTEQLDVLGSTTIYTVAPERIGGLDDRKIISNKGRVYTRDPYVYLKGSLRAGIRDVSIYSAKEGRHVSTTGHFHAEQSRVNLSRTSPDSPNSFAEITVPRKLAFVKTEVANTFLLKNYAPNREWFENYLAREAFIKDFAALNVALVFDNAHL